MTFRNHASIQPLESRRLLADAAAVASPNSVLADMNGDGKADLVTLGRNSTFPDAVLTIAIGRGNGTFVPSDRVVIRANTAFAMNVGDLDGDGALDVAVAGENPLSMGPINGTFVITALGEGNGKFKRVPTGANAGTPLLHTTFVPQVARARAVSIVDVDDNGHGEVSVLGTSRTSATNADNSVLVVSWDVTLDTLVAVPPTVVPFNSLVIINQLHTADLDGDGAADLVATNRTPMPPSLLTVVRTDLVTVRFPLDHTAVVRQGINPLNVLPPVASPTVPAIETFGLADLDGDASPDLVGRANSTLRFASYAGGNTLFGPTRTVLAANAPPFGSLANFRSGDVTGDGLDDVLANSRYGPILAVNITQPTSAVAVRWKRVPSILLLEESTDGEVATQVGIN